MKRIYYLLFLSCIITVNSCKKKNNDDNDTEAGKDKIVGKITLPPGSSLNVNTLRILSPIEDAPILNGGYAIDTFAKKFSTTLVVNSNNDIVMMGYNYPGQENHDVTAQTTALAMFMNAPALQSLPEDSRVPFIKKVIELPQFANFVTEVSKCITAGTSVLQADSSNLTLVQAYVALFEKAAVLRNTGYFRPEPIIIKVSGKVIGLTNNNVAHAYVAGFYKNGTLLEKKTIKGTKMFASSLKDLYQGIFGNGYSTPDFQDFAMSGDGEYILKIRSGKPGEGNDGGEFTDAQMENVSLFIFQWLWDHIPVPSECAGEIKDNITNNIKTYLSIPKANSLEEFGNSLYDAATNYIKNASGFLEKCTKLPQGSKAEQYIKKFNSFLKYLDFASKVGDGMNTACHVFDLFNSRPAIDTCFKLTGNVVSSNCKVPSLLAMYSGNNQVADGGGNLLLPIVVEVRDDNGALMPGIAVTWEVVQGGGNLTNVSTSTVANGQASNIWKLGAGGVQSVSAKVLRSDGSNIIGSPVFFSASYDSTAFYQAAVVGGWTLKNAAYPNDPASVLELNTGGTGKYTGRVGQPFPSPYPITWRIVRHSGNNRYYLYEDGFVHPAFNQFRVIGGNMPNENLSYPVTFFKTYQTGSSGTGLVEVLTYTKQ